jgi:hypothetical protein
MASMGHESYPNRSAEWRRWTSHYRQKGCSRNKALKLACKKVLGY